MTRACALTAACLLAACSRAPVPPGASQTRSAGPASATSADSAGAAFSAAAPALPDGCWSGFSTDVDARAAPLEQLAALAERCASGMRPLAPAVVTTDLAPGQTKRHDFEVRSATSCVRLLAIAGATVADLDLDLLDARGTVRARDRLRAPFALAPTPGTICLEPGKYQAVVSAAPGARSVAVAAYAAE